MISYCDLFLMPINPSLSATSFPSIILLALVPLSMISIFVITPIVRIPFGSSSLAIWRPSEVVISALAGNTHKMIVLESDTYLFAIVLVICSMLSGWSEPCIGILVIPGRSTIVKSGHVCEYTVKTIGLSIMFLLLPQILSVKKSIVYFTSAKFVNFLFGTSSNLAHGSMLSGEWFNLSSRGLLVTTPSPLGKKSNPTIDSNTDDLPAD